MPLQYAYLIGCLLYGLIWFAIFLLRKDLRKELILILYTPQLAAG